MRKPYYQDYVNHMMRHYVKWLEKHDTPWDEVAEINLESCERTLKRYSLDDCILVVKIYQERGTSEDGHQVGFDSIIRTVSQSANFEEKLLWALWTAFTKDLARERGLI